MNEDEVSPTTGADQGREPAEPVSENHTTRPNAVFRDGQPQVDVEVGAGESPPQEVAEVDPPPVAETPVGRRLRMPSGVESEFIRKFRFAESDFADEESFESAVMKFPYVIRDQRVGRNATYLERVAGSHGCNPEARS